MPYVSICSPWTGFGLRPLPMTHQVWEPNSSLLLGLLKCDHGDYRNTISYQRKLWSCNSVARYAVQVPPVGGDTCFADASRALATLPEAQRKRRQDTFALATFQDPKLNTHAVFRFILYEFFGYCGIGRHGTGPDLQCRLESLEAICSQAGPKKLQEQSSTWIPYFRIALGRTCSCVAVKVCEVFVSIACHSNPRILQRPIWQFHSNLARLIMMHFIMWRNQAPGLRVQMSLCHHERGSLARLILQDIKHICEKSFCLTPALFLPTKRSTDFYRHVHLSRRIEIPHEKLH